MESEQTKHTKQSKILLFELKNIFIYFCIIRTKDFIPISTIFAKSNIFPKALG